MATLTAKFIEQARPGPQRQEIPDTGLKAVKGLYFIIQPSGARSWALRYRYGRQTRKLTLGAFPAFGLVEARKEAGAKLRMLAEGKDPAAEKRRERDALSNEADKIENVLDRFYDKHVKFKNRPRTAEEVGRLIKTKVRPAWKGRRVQDITRRDIVKLVDGIADGGSPITANRVFALVRKFFNWCVEKGHVEASPCMGLKAPGKEVSRDRVLTDDELRLVWKAADALGWPFGPMNKLLLLTGQRREEVAGVSWNEFNLDGEAPLWTIKKERVKNGIEHVVPLAPAAVEILKSLPKIKSEKQLVFTTTGESRVSGFSRAKARLDEKMLELAQAEAKERGEDPEQVTITPWRVHDLRRTAASGMARLGQPIHVVEKILNHSSGTFAGIVQVYQRHEFIDERRRALTAWADFVMTLIQEKPAGNVVRLRG